MFLFNILEHKPLLGKATQKNTVYWIQIIWVLIEGQTNAFLKAVKSKSFLAYNV